jgi:hypothetical protein
METRIAPITEKDWNFTKEQLFFGVRWIDLRPEAGVDFGAHLVNRSRVGAS